MIEGLVLEKVRQEIEKKTWGVTEQFLDVHQIEYVNGQPQINRIDFDNRTELSLPT
jgi:hypothetical protein